MEQAEELGLDLAPGPVEGGDDGGVRVAGHEPERVRMVEALEELARAVGRAVVDDDQAERLRRVAEGLEARAREG